MMKRLFAAGCLLMLLLSAGAYAEEGYYFSTTLGYSAGGTNVADVRENVAYGYNTQSPEIGADLELERGGNLGLAVGYRFDRSIQFRLEGELGWESHLVKEVKIYGAKYASDSDVAKVTLMLNGYYDIIQFGPFTPYLTAGVGGAQVSVDHLKVETLPPSMTERNLFSLKENVFLYQVGAGIGVALTDTWTIDLKYRFLDVDSAHFEAVAKPDADFGTADAEFQSHVIAVGIRVNL